MPAEATVALRLVPEKAPPQKTETPPNQWIGIINRPSFVRCAGASESSREILLTREWLVTNGLGGYASGTVSGAVTRRYHGLLIAALPIPLGRVLMWSHVSEFLRFGEDDVVSLGGEERAGGQLELHGADFLHEFRLEDGLPIWIYHVRDVVLEKRIILPHQQNRFTSSIVFSKAIPGRDWNCIRLFTFGITRLP